MTRFGSGTVSKRGMYFSGKPSAAELVSTTGPSIEVGDAGTVHVEVNVSAVTGTTPTMVVVIEGSNDLTNWYTLAQVGANGATLGGAAAAPTNITAAGVYRAAVPCTQFVRYRSVIGGTTPSFTYRVDIEASVAPV